MHYHVTVIEDESEEAVLVETFEHWKEAEGRARTISKRDDWLPTQYPGRSSRPGEISVHLDRRVLGRGDVRREVSVTRCGCPDGEPQPVAPAPKQSGARVVLHERDEPEMTVRSAGPRSSSAPRAVAAGRAVV